MHDSIACGKRDNGYCDGGEATFIRYFAEVMAVMATEKTSSLLEFIRTENRECKGFYKKALGSFLPISESFRLPSSVVVTLESFAQVHGKL